MGEGSVKGEGRAGSQNSGVRNQNKRHRRDAKNAKKTILAINELNKRILGTAIEVLSVKRGATVVFYLLNPQRTLRLCGEKQV
jgi:hypothetical protein